MKATAKDFELEARIMLNLPVNKVGQSSNDEMRAFSSNFGVSFEVCAELWRRLDPERKISKHAMPKHLLWTICHFRIYCPEATMMVVTKSGSRDNFRLWTRKFTEAIDELSPEVIVFSNRFKNWNGKSGSLITIDGTDSPIMEPWPYNPIWWSHKFNGPGVKYEIGVCIATGDIVWISGPFPCAMQDREVFDLRLSKELIEGETVEADSGYTGREQIMTPDVGQTSKARKQKSQARGRHENINGRFKFFGIMREVWRGKLEDHGEVVRALSVIIQLGFDLGAPMYEIDFDAVTYD